MNASSWLRQRCEFSGAQARPGSRCRTGSNGPRGGCELWLARGGVVATHPAARVLPTKLAALPHRRSINETQHTRGGRKTGRGVLTGRPCSDPGAGGLLWSGGALLPPLPGFKLVFAGYPGWHPGLLSRVAPAGAARRIRDPHPLTTLHSHTELFVRGCLAREALDLLHPLGGKRSHGWIVEALPATESGKCVPFSCLSRSFDVVALRSG